YSLEDDREARRTYGYVLTYLVFVTSWAALALGLLSPWLVRALAQPPFYKGSRAVAPLAFAFAVFGCYTVVAIGVGRARRTQFNWAATGLAALVNVALNLILIPRYGMMGAAVATLVAYTVLFVAMTARAQRVYPVPYQWRRVATLFAAAAGLTALGKALDAPLAVVLALIVIYPLVLLPLGFYLPAERRRLRALVAARVGRSAVRPS
ncbi:MAG: polysaccharide biosynthesis C-terminal domain-containing protein, partial [Actinomycetota bacterium]|nr:polysaccharide biosynthesis C-terminal domain-containing protein [Actinomycetota bacterium]